MSIKRAIISATLGSLFFSGLSGADEIKDHNGNALYGRISAFTADGVVFNQNCGDQAATFAWSGILEARFSGDCSAAKSWRGGGDPSCDWVKDPKVIASLEMMPEVVPLIDGQPATMPFGTATEIFGRDGDQLHYRDACSGLDARIPLQDLVVTPSDGYCRSECE